MSIRIERNIEIHKDFSYTVTIHRSKKLFVKKFPNIDEARAYRDEIDKLYPSKKRGPLRGQTYNMKVEICQELILKLYVMCEECERVTGHGIVTGDDYNMRVLCPKCAELDQCQGK